MKLLNRIIGRVYKTQTYEGKPAWGYYYDSGFYLVDIQILANLYNAIKKKTTKIIPNGSSVFFSKNVDFSRTKFRMWAASRDVSIVRSPKKADIIIIDMDSYNDFVGSITKEFVSFRCINGFWGFYWVETRQEGMKLPDNSKKCHIVSGLYKSTIKELNQFPKLIGHDSKFMSVKSLVSVTLTEAMTEEIFQTVKDMLVSDVQEDVELGMEMLSNYSWLESAHMIAKTFWHCRYKIENSKNYNSVTFAHLKPMFERYSAFHNMYDEDTSVLGFLIGESREGNIPEEEISRIMREKLKSDILRYKSINLGPGADLEVEHVRLRLTTKNSTRIIPVDFHS